MIARLVMIKLKILTAFAPINSLLQENLYGNELTY